MVVTMTVELVSQLVVRWVGLDVTNSLLLSLVQTVITDTTCVTYSYFILFQIFSLLTLLLLTFLNYFRYCNYYATISILYFFRYHTTAMVSSSYKTQQHVITPHKRRGPIAAEFSSPGPASINLPGLIGCKQLIKSCIFVTYLQKLNFLNSFAFNKSFPRQCLDL